MKHYRIAGPGLLLVGAVALVPVGLAVWSSWYRVRMTSERRFIGLDNYEALLTSADWWRTVATTAAIALGVALVQTALGVLVAGVLRTLTRARRWIAFLVLVPFALLPYGSAVTWLTALDGGFLALWLGTGEPGRFHALAVVVLTEVWRGTGIAALICYLGFARLPPGLLATARAEGATLRQMTLRVVLPALLPAAGLALGVRFMDGLRLFESALAMRDRGYDVDVWSRIVVAGVAEAGEIGLAAAAAILMLSLVAVAGALLAALLRAGRVI